MLFFEFEFIFLFLPITLGLYFAARAIVSRDVAFIGLAGASLLFYGYRDHHFIAVLLSSVAWNYLFGLWIAQNRSRFAMVAGVVGNLSLLGYFKYAGFLVR